MGAHGMRCTGLACGLSWPARAHQYMSLSRRKWSGRVHRIVVLHYFSGPTHEDKSARTRVPIVPPPAWTVQALTGPVPSKLVETGRPRPIKIRKSEEVRTRIRISVLEKVLDGLCGRRLHRLLHAQQVGQPLGRLLLAALGHAWCEHVRHKRERWLMEGGEARQGSYVVGRGGGGRAWLLGASI